MSAEVTQLREQGQCAPQRPTTARDSRRGDEHEQADALGL